MPIYEYRCENCGEVNSVLQKMSDPPPEACRECQQGPLTKMMSQTSFILKGSGWYVTDFRDGGKKPPKDSEAKSSDKETAAKDSDTPVKSSDGGSSDPKSAPSATGSSKSSSSKSSSAPASAKGSSSD